jgi:hypothetical protein
VYLEDEDDATGGRGALKPEEEEVADAGLRICADDECLEVGLVSWAEA